MSDSIVNETAVVADPFDELRAGRMGLQEFTQALWLSARKSQMAAELALSRLEILAEEGVLETTKYQELRSMTRSLLNNAGQRQVAQSTSTRQTAIERQKAQLLAERAGEREAGRQCNDDAAAETVIGTLDQEVVPENTDVHAETSDTSVEADNETASTLDMPPVPSLKPATDAEAKPDEPQSPPLSSSAIMMQQVEIDSSVHKAASVDTDVRTVQLNTAEHLTTEADFDLEPMHGERVLPTAVVKPVQRSRSRSKAPFVLAGVLVIAGLIGSWYAEQRGWIELPEPVSQGFKTVTDSALLEGILATPQMSDETRGSMESVDPTETTLESDVSTVGAKARFAPQRPGADDVTSATGSTEETPETALQTGELESLYQALVQASQDGNLEPASTPGTALQVLAVLESGGAGSILIQRAKARIAQAYLSQARVARQANDWAKAELLVSKAVRLREQ